MERRAVEAERETDEMKKAEYMVDKIGEEYDGMISSVTNFGLFVELPNTIEGLVHVSYLTDDYYRYDEQHFAMIGERTGNVFRIGDEITIRVINVNKDERAIDFEIVGMKAHLAVSSKIVQSLSSSQEQAERNCGGRSERINERGGERGTGRKFDRGGKGKGRGSASASASASQPGKKMVTVREKSILRKRTRIQEEKEKA